MLVLPVLRCGPSARPRGTQRDGADVCRLGAPMRTQNASRGGSTTAPVAAPAALDFFGVKGKEAGRAKKPNDPSRTGDAGESTSRRSTCFRRRTMFGPHAEREELALQTVRQRIRTRRATGRAISRRRKRCRSAWRSRGSGRWPPRCRPAATFAGVRTVDWRRGTRTRVDCRRRGPSLRLSWSSSTSATALTVSARGGERRR